MKSDERAMKDDTWGSAPYRNIRREYSCPTISVGLDFLGLSVQRAILSMMR